jgi:hypothetical protein
MPEYSKLQQKFHLISGTYIAGKIFTDYAFMLKDEYSHKVKGETTKINRVSEAEAAALRLVKVLWNDLTGIGCEMEVTQGEVEKLEETLYSILTLTERNQIRVNNLIQKLKKEEQIIETV